MSATPIPIKLIPHQAMQEHHQPRRGIRERRAHRARVKCHGLAVHPHRGRLVQGATRALEPITDQAIQRSDHGATATRGRQHDLLPDPPLLHGPIDGPSQQRRAGPDRLIGAARKRVVDDLYRTARRTHTPERTPSDTQVHVPNAARKRAQVLEHQRAQRPQLVRLAHSRPGAATFASTGRIRAEHELPPPALRRSARGYSSSRPVSRLSALERRGGIVPGRTGTYRGPQGYRSFMAWLDD